MDCPSTGSGFLSRRRLLKGLGFAPLYLRSSPLLGTWASSTIATPAEPMQFSDLRFEPRYPARSPLEDVLRRVPPGTDEFLTELYAFQIEAVLRRWAASLSRRDFTAVSAAFHTTLQTTSLLHSSETSLRRDHGVRTSRRGFSTALRPGPGAVTADLALWLPASGRVLSLDFEMTVIDVLGEEPLTVREDTRYSLVLTNADGMREQRVGLWRMDWICPSATTEHADWKLSRWQVIHEECSVSTGGTFVDVTPRAMQHVASYRDQLLPGSDEWRSQIDGASGIDVYGNNGVAAGDYNNDGFDDLYICQPAGLPNRLYRNRGDGTFDDVTEQAGVGVLDNTACAIFADFRNVGLQDLIVVCGTGPLLFVNQGNGTFARKQDAFKFLKQPEGTFTHASVADYDNDGRLDIYLCVYSYYLGLDQYHYPAPYFDARNGPPNFLFHNEGDGTFADRTEAAGLNAENDRYSFACAWGSPAASGLPDLYVVNDFGRNNLYRNVGGKFQAASTEAHVEDVGAGMSAAWGDFDGDGRDDLYVANMWSAAGQRVSQQKQFHERSTATTRELYRRHARGNALYRNIGNGTFTNTSEQANVEVGRWAWCSDFLDFDHDGYQDLYVTNGYITAPSEQPAKSAGARTDEAGASGGIDLGSFFWRQVVAKSSDDATPSLAYEHGWNALNELIRTDSSWSGNERNVLLANNHDGTFSEISGAIGLDFLEDSRSFALADLDHDGRLEIILKNRSAPQLRILRNAMQGIGDSVAFRLRGTRSNRDAIGAVITLEAGALRQTRHLQAGTGFLAQHSKELFFGVGSSAGPLRATVRWPSGLVQHFEAIPRNQQVSLAEGSATFTAQPFTAAQVHSGTMSETEPLQAAQHSTVETWLLDPLRAPGFTLADAGGRPQTLASTKGNVTLLYFWSADSKLCDQQMLSFRREHAALVKSGLMLLAVNVDRETPLAKAKAAVVESKPPFPVLFADEETAGVYNIIFRYAYDRRRNMPLPVAFLLDRSGMIVKIYQGSIAVSQVAADGRSIPSTSEQRMTKGLPFPGTLHEALFARNDFTYGVAMFQHGYLNQAAESFQQVIASRPNDPEAYYNLGTLDLRRGNYDQAKQHLQQTLRLKPNYPEAWNNLGMLAGQQGQMVEAVDSFKQSLALRPTYATALLNLGNIYRRQHSFGDAQQLLDKALALQPDDPEVNYSLGMLYAQQNQGDLAADYLHKALALRPDYPEALNNLGVMAVRQGKYPEAEMQFKTCVRLVPMFDESYINLARLYLLQNQRAQARDALEQLLKVKPGNAAALQGLKALDVGR